MLRVIVSVPLLLLALVGVSFADCGTIPLPGQAVLRQLAVQEAALVRSASDDDRRLFARHAAEQLAFTLDPAWGTKRAGAGRPPSKDAVARIVDGRLCGWDLVNGATRELTFGTGEDITGQDFLAVTPTNHVGATPPPPPIDGELAELRRRLAEVSAALDVVTREREVARARAAGLEREVDGLTAQLLEVARARDAALAELAALQARPAPRCEAVLPSWAVRLGLRVGCRVLP